MRTSGKPWYRTGNDAWYVEINGKQIMLCKGKANKAEARRLWVKEMAKAERGAPTGKEHSLSDCIDHYLATLATKTRRTREQVMRAFLKHVGKTAVVDLSNRHVKSYLDPDWSPSTVRTHIKTILACLNRAVRDKLITANPIRDVEKPAWERREAVLSAEDLGKIEAAATEPFLSLLRAMAATGCRPGEICGLQVEHCDPARALWLVANKTAGQTGIKVRKIYVNAEIAELTAKFIGDRTSGPVFRNANGDPWTTDTVRLRFTRLRKSLGLSAGAIPYGTRHRFASDAINANGMDSLVVAKMMGHANPTMLAKTYFREDEAAMREAAEKATAHKKKSRGGESNPDS